MNKATQLALDLEEQIPAQHRNISAGDAIADILAIVASVKAQDWKGAAQAVAKLINDLLPQTPAQLNELGGKINWANVIAILGKLLPLILGGLTA